MTSNKQKQVPISNWLTSLKRKAPSLNEIPSSASSSPTPPISNSSPSTPMSTPSTPMSTPTTPISTPKLVDLDNLPWDPADRIRIIDYHPNQRDAIRRKYWLKGPCQPREHDFPQTLIGNKNRRFVPSWFKKYPDWLEYSIKADKAFCLCCYLCRDISGLGVSNESGRDAWMTTGYSNWKEPRFDKHVGEVNSFHNRALKRCEDLMRQNQSIPVALNKQDDIVRKENRIRLTATIDACRFCLKCALPFRGHDESETSSFKGVFLELMDLIISQNEELRKLPKAPGNNKYLCPNTQKDVAHCFEEEVLKRIFLEIGDDVFALLVDESSDVSGKEQMAIVLRFVDKHGVIKERFVGLVHVMETSSLVLKSAIDDFFTKHNLSLNQLRGQGYDGASNMRGEFNGLKARILEENKSAYYVHCFAHQLQLVVVAVARKQLGVATFFEKVATLLNVVGASCKRKDIIRETERERVASLISCGLIETGTGLNQELSLARPGDTRWNSHYKTLMRIVDLFPTLVNVLNCIVTGSNNDLNRSQANGILEYFETFEFVFYLHLMLHILGLTDTLSRGLQKKDQEILEAISLVESTKAVLQDFRENGFDQIIGKVSTFCGKHDIQMLNMTEDYAQSRSRRQKNKITNEHFFKFDCFNAIIDRLLQEFGDRFNEVNMDLLRNMSALSPRDSFSQFNASKLLRLCEFYPCDFDDGEKIMLEHQLALYHHSVLKDPSFANLNSIGDLAKVMVEARKHLSYHLVYRLLKLALILPVATASVERSFSVMKRVKSSLCNRIGDDFFNACVICAVELDELDNVTTEEVINRFQKMKTRRGQL